MRPVQAITLVSCIASVGAALASAEFLALRRQHRQGQPLAWGLHAMRCMPKARDSHVARWASLAFDTRGVLVLHFIRVTCALISVPVLLAIAADLAPLQGAWWWLVCSLQLIVALLTVVVTWRYAMAAEGSDQLLTVILVPAASSMLIGSAFAHHAALLFVAAQAVLSYGVAGVAKIAGPLWRKGEATYRIASTAGYGHPALAELLRRHPVLRKAADWFVIGFECAAPPMLFIGGEPLYVWLTLAATFHVMTALGMGLPIFPWAWLATYPSIVYASGIVS